MWQMIASLELLVQQLQPAFTTRSWVTAQQLPLCWVMCLGKHTLARVTHSAQPQTLPDNSQRHDLDCYDNFFARSAWTASELTYRVAVLVLTRLNFFGRITLLVDDSWPINAARVSGAFAVRLGAGKYHRNACYYWEKPGQNMQENDCQ